jgi:hypothetical protein
MAKMNPMPSKKDNGNGAPQCTDCPLCVILINHQVSLLTDIAVIKNSYAVLQVSDIADHSYQQWKPPNG